MQPTQTGRFLRAAGAAALVAFSLPALVSSGPALVASRGQNPPPQQSRYDEFSSKFKQALTINASDEIANLVKVYQDEAVNFVDNLCEAMAKQNSDELEKQFHALNKGWKTSFGTGFVEKLYVYHSELALDVNRRTERKKLAEAFNGALVRFQQNASGAKAGPAFELLGEEFRAMAVAFDDLGDSYNAGKAAGAAASCFDDNYRGKSADLRRACEYLGKALACFEKVELKHNYYLGLKQRHERLVLDGWAAPPPDPNAPDPTKPVAATASAVVLAASFETLSGPEAFVRPNYHADEVYQLWPSVYLQAKGTTGTIQPLEKGPLIIRQSASQLGIDFDRDGTAEKTVGITGNTEVVEVSIGEGAEKRRWAFAMRTGVEKDNYQSLEVNLQPSDKQASLYTINAGSVVLTLGETKVRVLDDNMDGIFGSPPKLWGFAGLAESVHQPEMDSVVIGESKRALPWSQYLDVGGSWYELKPQNGGLQYEAVPTTMPLGRLKLEYKGEQPRWLVVHGTGPLENCYFDLAAEGKKAITVPAGTYELFCGMLSVGKKQQVSKALILPGPTMQKWVVAEGAETAVALGAPYGFDFRSEVSEDKVKVIGKSVVVTGVAGERYDRTWNCVPRPEASVRKVGTKKGSKPEKLAFVDDLYAVGDDGVQKYTMADTWRPLDTEVEFKKAAEGVEVQLTEKKNKLFGAIESIWR